MALSLGVKVGKKIQVGGDVIEVKSLAPPALIVVSVNGGPDLVVSDQARHEVIPGVFISTGVTRKGGNNRLAIEAPPEVEITRMSD